MYQVAERLAFALFPELADETFSEVAERHARYIAERDSGAVLGLDDDETSPTYTLAQIRSGTGWPQGVRFKIATDDEDGDR